jgi:hypothetical protein
MRVPPPFRLTREHVARARLDAEAAGLWALVVAGCYHLFETERAARRAYRLLLKGVAVR